MEVDELIQLMRTKKLDQVRAALERLKKRDPEGYKAFVQLYQDAK